ncbi:MAG: WD40 repeat domain-containing protein [Planctomycetes bacterium]|nr:WD40 repeat domain-containing protein [Planctomycetota bacterium]
MVIAKFVPLVRILLVACLSFPLNAARAGDEKPKKPSPRTDLYGDPLPEGALARFGSVRFRHAGLSSYVFLDGGKTVVSSGGDRMLRFWDVDSGKQTRAVELQGTAGAAGRVTLSADGKTLAAMANLRLVFWEVDTGKELRAIPRPKSDAPGTQVRYMRLSPDGKTLAIAWSNWRVTLCDWQAEKQREFPLPVSDNTILSFDSTSHGSFSPDGKWFVAGASWQQPLGIFEAATGREVHRLNCFASTSTVSADSRRLAVSSSRNDKGESESVIRLFDLASGKEVAQFPLGTEDGFYSLAFSPDGKTLACGFSDRSCVLDLTSGRVLQHLPGRPINLSFSPDGKTLAASTGRGLRFWEVATWKERHDLPGDFGYDPAMDVSPDGRILAVGDWTQQTLNLWDTTQGRLLSRLPLKGEGRYVRNIAFSPDGQSVVACQGIGFLQFWDVNSRKQLGTAQLIDPAAPKGQRAYFYQLYVSPDGQHVSALERILGRGEVTRLALWETVTGKPVGQQVFPGELRRVAWLAHGKAAALLLKDGLALVELPAGLIRFRIPDISRGGPLAVSPDSRLLAAAKKAEGEADLQASTVAVWETATGKEIAAVEVSNVGHLALACDNRTLVTTAAGMLRAWDLATGKERCSWKMPVLVRNSWIVEVLCLMPDGKRGITALADGTGLVWDLAAATRPAEPLVKQSGEDDLAAWWANLAHEDASRAYAAVWRLAESPQENAIAFLRKHLRPAPEPDLKDIRRLIADLDSDIFAVRDKAFKRLEEMGNAAESELRATLKKASSLELHRRLERLLSRPRPLVSSPETLRYLRAIGVLEQIASKDARRLLEELSRGAVHAVETQEARASVERLLRRPVEE